MSNLTWDEGVDFTLGSSTAQAMALDSDGRVKRLFNISGQDLSIPAEGGYSGFSGFSGISGESISGASGFSGVSGFSGLSGLSGTSGFSGTSGLSGVSGTSGFSGMSGVAPSNSGQIISLTGSYHSSSAFFIAAGTSAMRTYALSSNSYSYIRARATGYFSSSANSQSMCYVTLTGLGGSVSPQIKFRADAIAAGKLITSPYTIEYQAVQTASGSLSLVVTREAGGITAVCDSFVVEGIL